MEELKELMSNVTSKVKEVQSLRDDRNLMQQDLVETMQDNFKKLFYPDAKDLQDFINLVWKNDIHWNYNGNYHAWINSSGEVNCELVPSDVRDPEIKGDFYVEVYRDCGGMFTTRFGVKEVDSEILYNGIPGWHSPEYYKSYLEGFLPYFKTEEDTLKCTQCYKKIYAMILKSVLEDCDVRIGNLKESIEKLKATLSSASTVVEKEDGSIELTLNGKTYIGKVKEEK